MLGGYEVGDANWAPRPIEPYVTALRRSPGKLRVAVTATNPFDAAVDPEAIHGLRVGAELLAALGHEVVEASPAWPRSGRAGDLHQRLRPGDRARHRRGRAAQGPRAGGGRARAALAARSTSGAKATPTLAYLGAVAQMQAIARGLVAFFADYDVLMTPALAERPLAIGECNGLGEHPHARPLALRAVHALHVAVQRHRPARDISLPVGFGADGLPTGVQIVGKPLNEDVLLQVAAQMEAAHPWAHQRPSM